MAAINPYLNFNGTCEKAFDFYKSVFGGEFTTMMRFKDAPASNQMPGEENFIMHVSMPIGKTNVLMGSDTLKAHGAATTGTNFSVSITAESEEEAKKLFVGLSAGGQVTMALEKTFWGALFGMFKDKYDINWMVNYDYPKS